MAEDTGRQEAGEQPPEASIMRIAHTIIQQAIRDGASEVRVEYNSKSDETWVAFFSQEAKQGTLSLPGRIHPPLIVRYKIMAEMNIQEDRAPQQGQIRLRHQGKGYNLDVHSEPDADGEQVWFTIRPVE